MKISTCFYSAFFLIQLCTANILFAQPVNDEACQSFFMVYCTTCHNTQRICKSLESQNEEAWKEMIQRMAKYGNMDENDEAYALKCMRYLEPGSDIICK